MRVRPALRAVALSTTFAGLLVLPAPSAAAAAKSKSKTSAKSTKSTGKNTRSASKPSTAKSSTAKSSAAKSSSAKSSAAKSSSAKSSSAKATAPSKATFDPVSAPSAPIPAAPPTTTTAIAGPPPQRGPTRIDFDDRLIQGQTNKSGAVYLYDRKELKQRSMIKKRESFREEIVGAVYDSEL
jgi:hypothetical protein